MDNYYLIFVDNLSTLFMNINWKDFIAFLEKNHPSPVLIPLLKKTFISETVDNVVYIGCENLGLQIFLNSKKKEIEQSLCNFINNPELKIVYFIKEKDSKKSRDSKINNSPNETISFLSYQNNKEEIVKKSGLQNKFNFTNFAVSSSNEIAYAAALSVADKPGLSYNPFYLYGGVGVGKTHLTQSIANKVLEKDLSKKILYCSSEEFTNDLIESIRGKNTLNFRKKYRNLDILIVDDIQFIAGKNAVQEEFFHTFNSIINNGGQIILTSDVPPKDINKLEDRLRSRFSGGLTIDIQNPDFELRTAILLIKAKERNIEIDFEAARIIAEKVGDTRELEGRLLELYSKVLKTEDKLSINNIKQEFTKKEEVIRSKLNSHDVIKYVCSYYDIKTSQIKENTRKENIALPRQIIMYILRNTLKLKLEEIAFILKRKDHTTVIHGVDKITNLIIKNPTFKEEIDRIISSLPSST